MRQKLLVKRKGKSGSDGSHHDNRPRTKNQKSKISLPSYSNFAMLTKQENTYKDLKVTINPIYQMARNEIGVMEKLAKILEFRRLKFEQQQQQQNCSDSHIEEDKNFAEEFKDALLSPTGSIGKRKRSYRKSLKKSIREHRSPRTHRSADFRRTDSPALPYRTSDRKKKPEPIPEPLAGQFSDITNFTTNDGTKIPPSLLTLFNAPDISLKTSHE